MNATSGFVDAVCEVISTNNRSLTTMSDLSSVWSESTLEIGNQWIHGSELPGGREAELKKRIEDINSLEALDSFMSEIAPDPGKEPEPWPGYENTLWSLNMIKTLQSRIAQYWEDDENGNGRSGTWNGVASQMGSLIQSMSAQNTSTGDAQSKACQSALQNGSSAAQPASNAGDAVLGLLSNGSSVQSQI